MATNKKCYDSTNFTNDVCFINLNIGGIFRADFGLFYIVPRNSGALYNVTSVLDTYIYNGLTATGDVGMTAAAALYQSVVGACLLLIANLVVRRIEPDSALF